METPPDNSVQRRFAGSIDIEHYVAVAQLARAEEARTLGRSVRSPLRTLGHRLGQSRLGKEAAASAAVRMQGD